MINGVRLIGINSYPYSVRRSSGCNLTANKTTVKPSSNPYFNQNVSFTSIYKTNLLPNPVQYMEKFVNKDFIQYSLGKNPNISAILKSYGITAKISELNIDKHAKGHFLTTYFTSKEITKATKLSDTDKLHLYKASLLHDIGKALIPEEIIQKPGKLTGREREIVDLHAQLGYEILKPAKIENEILEAVRLHHTPAYLKKDNEIAKILSVADVYSALIEERVYKPRMADLDAFKIMHNMRSLAQDYVEILEERMF